MEQHIITQIARDAAYAITHQLPEGEFRSETAEGMIEIPASAVDPLTDITLECIAEVIATILDAGSEREVILEDEALRDQLHSTFDGWHD